MRSFPAGQPSAIRSDPSAELDGQRQRVFEFVREAGSLGVVVRRDEPLARHTTFRIGGPADLFAYTNTQTQLESLRDLAHGYGISSTILGGGSNILISDAGVRGLVIANQTREVEMRDAELVVDSGVMTAGLARRSIREGWSGLEWAVSVPGTVGGAIIGNAGAHGGQVADNLLWVLASFPGEGRRVVPAEELAFSYRGSAWKRCATTGEAMPAVLTAAFRLKPGDPHTMTIRAERYLALRRASQPVEPSAGSVFRNPPGDHAGRLIDAAGLKGYRVGGAVISRQHANFIVNPDRSGTAADVLELINLARAQVYESAGIELETEILLIGAWSSEPTIKSVGRAHASVTS